MKPIAQRLAEWGLEVTEFPADVRASALRHLLDGFGTALGAYRTGAARPAVEIARGLGGPEEAAILGTGEKVSAPAAALANGTLVHALDFDDTHAGGLVHATAVVLPTALAVGQQLNAAPRDVLSAAIVGYETVCRVAAAAPHGFHTRGLHATMVAGVFSSALVASRLLGLSVEAATNALGIAGSQAGGLLAFLGTGASTKQLHPGFASQAGILAARLAAAGATGPATVFDGPHGIFDAMAHGAVDRQSVAADLGMRWETSRIGIKPYPACQLSHATLGAVLDILGREHLDISEVVKIIALVHPDSASVVCDPLRELAHPASEYAAKFSLPWCTAAMLADGQMGLSTFDPVSIGRTDIAAMAALVAWDITSGIGAAADAPGDVRIILSDGRRFHGTVSRSAGGPDNPLSDAALEAKFIGNVGGVAPQLLGLLRTWDEQPILDPILVAAAETAAQYSVTENLDSKAGAL